VEALPVEEVDLAVVEAAAVAAQLLEAVVLPVEGAALVAAAEALPAVEEVLREAVPEEAPRSSLSPIVTKASSSPAERKTCLSPRTWCPAKASMEKSVFRSRTATEQRRSTASGIPSDPSWLPVSLVALITSILRPAKRCSILAALPAPPCRTLLTLSDL
jgi:hypothetical protein